MSLSLGDLMELAVLTAVMDAPSPLNKLLDATENWHELNGRADLRRQVSAVMRRLLDEGSIHVMEIHGPKISPTVLSGVEAQMALERVATGLKGTEDGENIEVNITDAGREGYRKLAKKYYNG